MEAIEKLDLIYYTGVYFFSAYLTALLTVFILKVMIMHSLHLKYDSWRNGVTKGILNKLPTYFCEWCTLFWLGLIIVSIFIFIFGNYYLIIVPLFSTPVALSKYK